MTDLTNCCYPPEEALTYSVNVDYILKDGVLATGNEVTVKVIPGQNVEGAVNEYFAEQFSTPIFYSTFNLIQRV